ncbi:putative non-specific serine/threonine protein kinase [Helianthus annuus]|nr:putative non-specific serine/threonine protein kinase [Helianthus annuus]
MFRAISHTSMVTDSFGEGLNLKFLVIAKLLVADGSAKSHKMLLVFINEGFECLSSLGPTMSPFYIVILNLHMPEMDGFEVATRIRKFRSRNRPLIITLTASA